MKQMANAAWVGFVEFQRISDGLTRQSQPAVNCKTCGGVGYYPLEIEGLKVSCLCECQKPPPKCTKCGDLKMVNRGGEYIL
ncbi:MAG: hypothetical protein L3V56_03680 [Candidatus Magnetoovum sp. WYHC-5]|nr:hypothetical protein [Candidatus Magnetoovum sp. WYHC-5]